MSVFLFFFRRRYICSTWCGSRQLCFLSACLRCRALVGKYAKAFARLCRADCAALCCAVLAVDARLHAASTYVGAGCIFLWFELKKQLQKKKRYEATSYGHNKRPPKKKIRKIRTVDSRRHAGSRPLCLLFCVVALWSAHICLAALCGAGCAVLCLLAVDAQRQHAGSINRSWLSFCDLSWRSRSKTNRARYWCYGKGATPFFTV